MCGSLTYDGHQGTDFRLKDYVQMVKGIPVLAAADGMIVGVRNNVTDRDPAVSYAGYKDSEKCGNGIRINHGEGWITQYCHMQLGSIPFVKGDFVKVNDRLGFVGLSGDTEFPHLHLSVFFNNKKIDPFSMKSELSGSCVNGKKPGRSVWSRKALSHMPYVQSAILNVGVAGEEPKSNAARLGHYKHSVLPGKTAVSYFWVDVIGGMKGIAIKVLLTSPSGNKKLLHQEVINDKAQIFQWFGIRNDSYFTENGEHKMTARLIYQGKVVADKKLVFQFYL